MKINNKDKYIFIIFETHNLRDLPTVCNVNNKKKIIKEKIL